MNLTVFSLLGSEQPPQLDCSVFPVLPSCPPSLLGRKRPVCHQNSGLFFYFLPPSHPLSFSGVKRSSLFSFSPQIGLLITSPKLSRIDFHSLCRLFFVCLRQRVSWSENRVSQSGCDGIIPHSPPTSSVSAPGWKWNCSSVLDWPTPGPGPGLGPGSGPRPCPAGHAAQRNSSLGQPPADSLTEMALKYIPLNDGGKATKWHSSLSLLSSGRRNYPLELCMG